MVAWTQGDTTVRWSGPAGEVEKSYELPPQDVMTWREYEETLVLVVEAINDAPFTPSDNAVVYRQGRIDLGTGEVVDTDTWR
ncbi:hypothetical protein ACFXKW_27185 [Streptomyces sp. NPDC059193]|uniref:hypothetical protein n=1 Tax=Streptomyces sp. NPDC059193 TaxID=3346763 RepID=UPI0036BC570B